MFGTNDLGSLDVQEYEAKTGQVVQKCLDNGTVVILSTAPPRHGLAEKAEVFAEAVRKIYPVTEVEVGAKEMVGR